MKSVARKKRVTVLKKRWRVAAGHGRRAVRVKLVKRKERVVRGKEVEQETSDEKEAMANAASATHQDNRNYLSVVIGGEVCRALFDPGATCSLAGASLVKRFSDRLKPSNSRIRTVRYRDIERQPGEASPVSSRTCKLL